VSTIKRTTSRAALAALVLTMAAGASGCASNPGDTQGSLHKYSGPVKVKTLEQTRVEEQSSPSIVNVKTIQNTEYVALGDVARAMGFHAKWLNDGHYGIGDNDAAWKFKPGVSTVQKGDDKIELPAPTIQESNRLYVPVRGLQKLFGDVAAFRADSKTVSFYPVTDQILGKGIRSQAVNPREAAQSGLGDGGLGGGSLGGGGLSYGSSSANDGASSNDGMSANDGNNAGIRAHSGSSSQEADELISEAKKYLGVKYDFGAGEYSETGKFDCSSFVQLLYGKHGVSMPRVARDQAELGRTVSRDNLKKGDLMYFFVPGRFKSDETVGHVTIYMGDGNMIHASPKPEDGVQITPIDKPYWARTFLFAKRVLPD
jgi:Cell wall-associated hydrolases (invasion-associated proteins)